MYRQIKASCEELAIGATYKEIGSLRQLRNKVDKLTESNVLEIEIKDVLFQIVLAEEVPMLYDQMDRNKPLEKKQVSKMRKGKLL